MCLFLLNRGNAKSTMTIAVSPEKSTVENDEYEQRHSRKKNGSEPIAEPELEAGRIVVGK